MDWKMLVRKRGDMVQILEGLNGTCDLVCTVGFHVRLKIFSPNSSSAM